MTWYEKKEIFVRDSPLPREFLDNSGPHGVALVDVFADGKTTAGWGLEPREKDPGFMVNYARTKFWHKPRLINFEKRELPYAIVMRAVNLVMVDIDRHLSDGGADGFIAAAKLDFPETLAETSKSGAGRHLYYRTDDTWNPLTGFAMYDDAIGIEPGIDIRAVGCSYRYRTQRWNDHELAPIPEWLQTLLQFRRDRKTTMLNQLIATAAADPDDEEALVMHDALLQELNKPIGMGKRNASLFAIGTKMKLAGFPDWNEEVERRALEVGLDLDEATKIITNVDRYS